MVTWTPIPSPLSVLSREELAALPKPVRCDGCRMPYGGAHWVEAVVPNEIWTKLSLRGNEGCILCVGCMGIRATQLGLTNIPLKITAGPFVAIAIDARQRTDPEEGLDPKGESAGLEEASPDTSSQTPCTQGVNRHG